MGLVAFDATAPLFHAVVAARHVRMTRKADFSIRPKLLMGFVTNVTIKTRHGGRRRKGFPFHLDLAVASETGGSERQKVRLFRQKIMAVGAVHEGHLLSRSFHFVGVTVKTLVNGTKKFVNSPDMTNQTIDPRLFKMNFVTRRLFDELPLRILAQVTLGANFMIEFGVMHHLVGPFCQIEPNLPQIILRALLMTLMATHHVMRG